MIKNGFDNDKYLKLQSERIKERINFFGGKLYLEFGGKLFDDYHASRVLPGFKPDSKITMLSQLKDQAEIVIVISSEDIAKNKVRSDLGITYDLDVLRLIDAFRSYGLYVGSVVLTKFTGQASVVAYQKKLESLGMKVYRHYPIEGYPNNISHIVLQILLSTIVLCNSTQCLLDTLRTYTYSFFLIQLLIILGILHNLLIRDAVKK